MTLIYSVHATANVTRSKTSTYSVIYDQGVGSLLVPRTVSDVTYARLIIYMVR